MRNMLNAFMKDENGAAGVEYGLLVALIAVAIIFAVQALGITLRGVFDNVNGTLAPAV